MSSIWAWEESEAGVGCRSGEAYFGQRRAGSGNEKAIAALAAAR